MKKEIEIKFLEIDVDKTKSKLDSIGAEKVFEGELLSITYSYKDASLLRLRKMGDDGLLTLKKGLSKDKVKQCDEYEVKVDFDEMRQIMSQLGYKEKKHTNKKRISYKFDDCSIEIDIYDEIPPFLEIEADNIESLEKCSERLGFDFTKGTSMTGKDVFEYYGC